MEDMGGTFRIANGVDLPAAVRPCVHLYYKGDSVCLTNHSILPAAATHVPSATPRAGRALSAPKGGALRQASPRPKKVTPRYMNHYTGDAGDDTRSRAHFRSTSPEKDKDGRPREAGSQPHYNLLMGYRRDGAVYGYSKSLTHKRVTPLHSTTPASTTPRRALTPERKAMREARNAGQEAPANVALASAQDAILVRTQAEVTAEVRT